MSKQINDINDDDLDDDLSITNTEKDVDFSKYNRNSNSKPEMAGVESVKNYDGRSQVGDRKKFGSGLSAMMILLILVAVGAVAYGVWYATKMNLNIKGGENAEEEVQEPSNYNNGKTGQRDFAKDFAVQQANEQKLAEEQALLNQQANGQANQEIQPVGAEYNPAPVPNVAPMPEQVVAQGSYAPSEPMEKPKSAHELRMERLLNSSFNGSTSGSEIASIGSSTASLRPVSDDDEDERATGGSNAGAGFGGGLSRLNNATVLNGVRAGKAGNRDLTLDKGAFIDCVMTTKFHSQLAGMLTCEVTRNIYSASGRVILVDRGSRVTGEYQGDVKTGQSRVFVVWNRIVTPKGVTINIDSPASSELGESGLTGRVNNHFFKRFGGAMLVSLVTGISDGVGKSVGASIGREIDKGLGNGNGTTVIDLGGSSSNGAGDVASKIIEQTSNIPPSIVKHQGDKVTIYVARDVDFSSVYRLK